MKFFIDTANLQQIKEAQDLGVLDGVTTNPSLMAKEGITGSENILNHYIKICEIVDGDVSAEVISTEFKGMIKEGEALAKLHPQIVVKIPMILDGVKALKYFSNKGIKTNCTLIFSVGQALIAAKAGATYVSPFIGRLDDISTDGLNLISEIANVYDNYAFNTQILAASVRHTMHIIDCAKIGADVMTGPLSSIKGLIKHPLTDIGLEKFLADYKKGNYSVITIFSKSARVVIFIITPFLSVIRTLFKLFKTIFLLIDSKLTALKLSILLLLKLFR
jgi:transaldolase